MSYVDITLHAGHDGSLNLLANDDVSGTGDSFVTRLNVLTHAGWSGWKQVGTGTHPTRMELRRLPDGRLIRFQWPNANGNVSVGVETAPGSRAFAGASFGQIDCPEAPPLANRGFLVRPLADGRFEVFVKTNARAWRSLQSAPGGSFPKMVDLDGVAAATPVNRLVCAEDGPWGSPYVWGVDAGGNLQAAQPSHEGYWRWCRTVNPADRVGTAWYEGRRGSHELFFTTETGTLSGSRIVDLPLPQITSVQVPLRRGSSSYVVDETHLLGHYAGDGRLYLFAVVGHPGGTATPAVVAETTPGSAWSAGGASWSAIQTPTLAAPTERVLRIGATSFHTDGRLACAALYEDGAIRVSTQASLGSTSWSAWGAL